VLLEVSLDGSEKIAASKDLKEDAEPDQEATGNAGSANVENVHDGARDSAKHEAKENLDEESDDLDRVEGEKGADVQEEYKEEGEYGDDNEDLPPELAELQEQLLQSQLKIQGVSDRKDNCDFY
jgi:hypothetical protein